MSKEIFSQRLTNEASGYRLNESFDEFRAFSTEFFSYNLALIG